MSKEKFIGKVCKVYLSKEQNEIDESMCYWSYGIIKDYATEQRKLKVGEAENRWFTLEPIDYVPDDIDYYHDVNYIRWNGKQKIYKQERKSPVIHEDKQVIKKK